MSPFGNQPNLNQVQESMSIKRDIKDLNYDQSESAFHLVPVNLTININNFNNMNSKKQNNDNDNSDSTILGGNKPNLENQL